MIEPGQILKTVDELREADRLLTSGVLFQIAVRSTSNWKPVTETRLPVRHILDWDIRRAPVNTLEP